MDKHAVGNVPAGYYDLESVGNARCGLCGACCWEDDLSAALDANGKHVDVCGCCADTVAEFSRPFTAGFNEAGCLPEFDAVNYFATADEARRWLIGEILRAAEQEDEWDPDAADELAAMAEDVNLAGESFAGTDRFGWEWFLRRNPQCKA